MNKLEQYINDTAEHGTSRSAFLLTANVNMKVLTHSLRWLVGSYVGRAQWRYVWFRTSEGIVLLLSGSKIVTEIVQIHLASYLGESEEFTVLYSGRGIQICKDIVDQELVNYDQSTPGHSFGGSRE